MTIIILSDTDIEEVKSGHCSNCKYYNEILVSDTSTDCKVCNSPMIHVERKLALMLLLIILSTVGLLALL